MPFFIPVVTQIPVSVCFDTGHALETRAGNHHFSVCLYHKRPGILNRVGAKAEASVKGPVGSQADKITGRVAVKKTEIPSDHYFPITQDTDVRYQFVKAAGIICERIVEVAVCFQAGNIRADRSIVIVEISVDKNFAIGLNHYSGQTRREPRKPLAA